MPPRVAVRAVIIVDEMILLSKYRDERGDWYVTPGGGVERGETLAEAFHRELFEETGVAAPFGEILFIREIIAERHPESNLDPAVHQMEVAVRSFIDPALELAPLEPDPGQVGVEWVPLSRLDQILFFPIGLVEHFKTQNWDGFYYGDIR